MRIWHPIPVNCLDEMRLKGEHAELHAIWNIITQCKRGYSYHRETKRWIGYLAALARRHDMLVDELTTRKLIVHKSPLPNVAYFGSGPVRWPPVIEPVEIMRAKLVEKILLSASI